MIGTLGTLAQQDQDAAKSLVGAVLAIMVGAGALFILLLVLMIMRRFILGGPKPKETPPERVDPWSEAGRRMRIDDEPQQLGGELGESLRPDPPHEPGAPPDRQPPDEEPGRRPPGDEGV